MMAILALGSIGMYRTSRGSVEARRLGYRIARASFANGSTY